MVRILIAWLSLLAASPAAEWWSVRLVTDPTVPPGEAWCRNEIDRFVLAKLRENDLEPSPEADRRTLIRRVHFDLLGLPPAPEAVERFLRDQRPDAYERLVDELLESEHYGERWARHWLDIAHYADTHGFERDKRRDHAWRYRDYVIRALNDDKPYDQFLREQIAGDLLWPDDPEAVVATGFLAAGPWDFVGQVETKSPVLRRSARALDLDDMLTQVMTSTMAMTVNCARCHDHKLDRISQEEYYELTALFADLKRGDRDISQAARKNYEDQRKRLQSELQRLTFAIGELEGKAIDLADVTGGGSGFGDGEDGSGIDARTGKIQGTRPFGDLGNVKPGNYASCDYDFIDGVFVPAGGETKISSTGLVARGLPENSGKAWDMIRNGPVTSQFSTKLGKTDYASDGHSLLGLHANAGLTFDLAKIREATNFGAMKFSTIAGYGGRTEEPSAEFRVLLDGELRAHEKIGRHDAVPFELEIPESARFLTFISTDGGNGYGHDQVSFGDPRLEPAQPRELTDESRAKLQKLRGERTKLEHERDSLGQPPTFYGVIAKERPVVHVLDRGNPEAPLEEVEPDVLSWTGHGNDVDDRVAFANWIVDEKNPLTRRVIVNRLWHWYFGQGLVTTPSDFGKGGSKPSHPDLLDWLAQRLLEEDWSLKAMHRLILTSATYRQISESRPGPAATDADNQLLWRMNPSRLEAEAVRDSVLAVSGKLNLEMFGPGFEDFDYKEAYAPIYTYKTADSPELWRRSVYRYIVRTTPQQFMTTLDCPDPANLTPKRNVTTTPLQSLALYNNEFMLQQSRYFAERLKAEAGDDVDAQIARGFALAFAREPEEGELQLGRELIESHDLLHFCRALLNANEFIYVD